MRYAIVLVGATLFFAGCLDASSDAGRDGSKRSLAAPPVDAVDVARATPHAVVALIDTGINPYHKTFRDPRPEAYLYPGTYLPDYPDDAIALNITLDAPNYWLALKKDCESVWKNIRPNQLYWFPGTKIVGGIFFQSAAGTTPTTNCQPDRPTIAGLLDQGGHGTMVASRAASFEYGACRDCKVVAVHGFTRVSVQWAKDNAKWIDAQSNSWGPFLPLMWPTAISRAGAPPLVGDADLIKEVEASAKTHLSFWASGNGALTRGGLLGHPTIIDPRMTPSIVMVGGHDSGYINTWPDFPPHVVSDSCNSWAADHRNTTRSADNIGGGTSGASPFAAGGAANMLLEARKLVGETRTGVRDGVAAEGTAPSGASTGPLTDGKLTLAEWKNLVFKTATPRPVRQYEDGSVCDTVGGLVLYSSTPVQWKDVPAAYPEFIQIGYGAVDNQSRDLAFGVLSGAKAFPDRSRTDSYFLVDAPTRSTLHTAYTSMP